MTSTKEQILEAAKLKFSKKEIFLDDAKKVSVTVRELTCVECDALDARLFVCDEKTGKPLAYKAGKPDPKGDEVQFKEGVSLIEEWLAATLEPSFAVEELQGPGWPSSLKQTLYKEARAINGVTVKVAAGN